MNRSLPLTILLTLLVGLLAACGTGGPAPSTAGPAGTADTDDCARIRELPAAGDARRTALVVDAGASGHPPTLGGAVATGLRDAQAEGDVLDVVAVDGRGALPRTVLRGFALDPKPGVQSDQADRARAMAVACVQMWATGPEAAPTAPGSDVVAALNEAARARPARLLVVSDGVSTAGRLDLGAIGLDADPDQVAEQLADGSLTDGLRDTTVTWAGLGATADGLPEPLRANVERVWTATLQRAGVPADRLLVDRTPLPLVDAPAGLPEDPVRVPTVATVTAGGTRTVTVPDALLFTPGSADLRQDADGALAPLAAQVGATGRVTVTGHCADYGDAAYQADISTRRAEAVAGRLVALGVPPGAVRSEGVGTTAPAADEWPNGVHDLAAAAANRRVVLTVSG